LARIQKKKMKLLNGISYNLGEKHKYRRPIPNDQAEDIIYRGESVYKSHWVEK